MVLKGMHRIGVDVNNKELAFLDWLKEEYGAPYTVTIRRGLRKLMEVEGFDFQANSEFKDINHLEGEPKVTFPSYTRSHTGGSPSSESQGVEE